MKNMHIHLILSGLVLVMAAGCASSDAGKVSRLDPKKVYDADGKFNPDAAKQVYLEFMKKSGYPVNDTIAKKLYVTDFGLGRFAENGLGCIVWWGDEKYNYSGLDAFLLPGQIIPEHWHAKLRDIPEKMESWLVRYGEIYTYAEGAPTPNRKARLAAADASYITVNHERILGVGDIAGISRPLEKHWMQAGPQGAVFTEFSTFHAGEAVKFTDPKIKF
jgi:D-lyxose ketol-isomerase